MGVIKAEAKPGGFRAFNGSSEPRVVFSRAWGAPEDWFVCFCFFSFESHFMFIGHFGITSTLLFPPMEGSLKWVITGLFISFYLFTFIVKHLPHKGFMYTIYFDLYKTPVC